MTNTSATSGKAPFASRAFDELLGGRGLLWPGFSELPPFLLTLSRGSRECKSRAVRPETFSSFLSDAFCDTATSQHSICTVKP